MLLVAASFNQFAIGQNCCTDMPHIIEDLQAQIDSLNKDKTDLRARVDSLTNANYQAQIDGLKTQLKNLNQSSGGTSSPVFDCKDIQKSKPYSSSGVYSIAVSAQNVKVYCDMTTNGGGWTVFQRRMDGSGDFMRNWANYSAGFGDLNREFWLGNDNLAAIVGKKTLQTLRIELEDWSGNKRYAEYNNFQVQGASTNYKLTSIGTFSGDAGDSLTYQAGQSFTTFDKDLDATTTENCAQHYRGAWWYNACHHSNLNGEYKNNAFGQGINWHSWTGHYLSLKATEMKFRSAA